MNYGPSVYYTCQFFSLKGNRYLYHISHSNNRFINCVQILLDLDNSYITRFNWMEPQHLLNTRHSEWEEQGLGGFPLHAHCSTFTNTFIISLITHSNPMMSISQRSELGIRDDKWHSQISTTSRRWTWICISSLFDSKHHILSTILWCCFWLFFLLIIILITRINFVLTLIFTKARCTGESLHVSSLFPSFLPAFLLPFYLLLFVWLSPSLPFLFLILCCPAWGWTHDLPTFASQIGFQKCTTEPL